MIVSKGPYQEIPATGDALSKTMPPTGNRSGALARSALSRNRLISQKVPSVGVLRDQQTLNQRTGTHGHLLLNGLMNAGVAFETNIASEGRGWLHITAIFTFEP